MVFPCPALTTACPLQCDLAAAGFKDEIVLSLTDASGAVDVFEHRPLLGHGAPACGEAQVGGCIQPPSVVPPPTARVTPLTYATRRPSRFSTRSSSTPRPSSAYLWTRAGAAPPCLLSPEP